MKINVNVENGHVLDVPILSDSPLAFELEVAKIVQLDNGRIFM